MRKYGLSKKTATTWAKGDRVGNDEKATATPNSEPA